MKRRYYNYAGLRVRSDLPIPEWKIFEEKHPFAAPEVIITLRRPAAAAAPDLPIVSPDEYYFHIPEAGAYRVRGGHEIIVTPAPKAGQRELRLFLLGSAWGALCCQRGFLSLHSSAIRVGDGAVAFCGSSGSGKSTAAAWLLNRGFLFAGDDLSRFDAPAGGNGTTWPTAYKYLQDALATARASGGTITEIRVAKGTYKPDRGGGQTAGSSYSTFELINGVAGRKVLV